MIQRVMVMMAGATIVAGCAAVVPSLDAPRPASGLSLELHPQASRNVQTLVHRWVASDIYQYEVTLRRWNGSVFADLSPPLTVIVPGNRQTLAKASFRHLEVGTRYQATVLAKGNRGGTAPTQVLNSLNPSVTTVEFPASQNVIDSATRSVSVMLDSVRFSGNVTVQPVGAPPATEVYDITISDADSGATLFKSQYPSTKTMVLTDLRPGVHYVITLVARRNKGQFSKKAAPITLYYDPLATDLEQDATASIPF